MGYAQPVKPNAFGVFEPVYIDIANLNETVVFDVGGWDSFSLQRVNNGSVNVGSNVLKVQKSNNGASPVDFSGAVTLSAEGMTATQEITAIGFVHAVNTTAGTSGIIALHARVQKNR